MFLFDDVIMSVQMLWVIEDWCKIEYPSETLLKLKSHENFIHNIYYSHFFILQSVQNAMNCRKCYNNLTIGE